MIDKFIIVDLQTGEFMTDLQGEIKTYSNEEDAKLDCGLYELENVWVVKLIFNHI